jgi:hypothetical protein
MPKPKTQSELALTLLVPRNDADNPHYSLALDDLTVVTPLFN